MSEENVELVRRCYEAFNRGDRDLLMSLAAADIELHVSDAFFDEPTTFRGHDGFGAQLRRMSETFDGFSLRPRRVIGRDNQVLAIVAAEATGKLSGARVQGVFGHLWTIRDAALVRFSEYRDVDEALNAARLAE
jgi:uncharacterized protein